MKTKICAGCKQEKLVDEFNWKSKPKGIRQYRCKPCQREYAKSYYNSGEKQKQIARVSKLKRNNKEEFKEYKKTLSCEVCDENAYECLDFHHLDPTKKDYIISSMVGRSLTAIKKEIDKCAVLCSNCHRKVHSGRIQLSARNSTG